jgi:hypothetical protein
MFSLTLPLCNQLQSINSDLTAVINHIENVIDVLNKMRSNSDDKFNIIFEGSHATLDELGCDVSISRCIKKQNNRNNIPSTYLQEYYKRSVFIPFLDHMTTHLSKCFLNHKEIISSLETLLPNHISNTSKGPSRECLDLYSSVLPDSGALKEEFLLWKTKCLKIDKNERPSNALQLLSECDGIFYPNIRKMLEILVTLPISTATAERTFSSLRRIKTYLRPTTSESRLFGLALLSIHNDISVNPDEVVSKLQFSIKKNGLIL